MGDTKGLVFLPTENMIISETLTNMLGEEPSTDPVDIRLGDFDDTEYHILVTPENKNTVQISIKMKCIKDVLPMGTKAAIDEIYGKMLDNKTENGFDLTFKFELDKLPYPKAELISKLASLRRNIIGAPIKRCFDSLIAGTQSSLKPMLIPFRNNSILLLSPGTDRIMVIYSVVFDDETDRVIAQVFLSEFVDAPKKVNGVPNVAFSKEPPIELTKAGGFREAPNTVGYISFQIFKQHVDGKKTDAIVSLLTGFRAYLHYHIKASKAHLHFRMRSRVESLLKVLNRANPEADAAEKATGMKNVTQVNATKAFRKF